MRFLTNMLLCTTLAALLLLTACSNEDEGGPNNAPIIKTPMNNITLTAGFGTHNQSFLGTFEDPDGDQLNYSRELSDHAVILVGLSGHNLVLTELGTGVTTVMLTADDGRGGTVTAEFTITVN